MRVRFTLNGKDIQVDCEPNDRLTAVLREKCEIRSARIDCASGRCGACLVLFEGRMVSGCMLPMFRVVSADIVTVEGLYGTQDLVDIERGFEKAGFEPCQYCASVKTLLAHAIISETTQPRREEMSVQAQAIRCRCTSYRHFVDAIRMSADFRRQHGRR